MKKLLTIGTLTSIASIATVISCGATDEGTKSSLLSNAIENVKSSPIEVKHSFDFLTQDKIHFESMLKTSEMKKDLNITNINNYEDENKMIINELVTNENASGKGAYTSVKGALFKYGTKSDLLLASGKNAFSQPQSMTKMKDADKYDYLSNLTGHTLAEGGNIGMELNMKNGVIYNVPSNSASVQPWSGDKNVSMLYTRYRPLVYVDKNYQPHLVDGVDSSNIASLSLNVNGKSLSAFERKGNLAKDMEFGEQIGTAEAAFAVEPSIQNELKKRDVLIYDTYFTSEFKTLDLTSLNAYEVSADESNGISTFNVGLFQTPNILQAPYSGKVTKVLSDSEKSSYKTKRGISLVITKDPLNLGDEVKTEYKINPKYSYLNDAKWAVTSQSYSSTNWAEEQFANKFDNQYKQSTYKDGDNHVVAGGNHIIIKGQAYSFAPNKSYLNRTLFVADTKKKMYGMITIAGTNGSIAMDTNLIPAYLMSLGIDEAVHFDGGGSSHSYEKMSGDTFRPFQKSIDSSGWRALLTAFAIGEIND